MPNPGRVGLGVSISSVRGHRVIEEPIGIGSNLMAELCGLQRALTEVEADLPGHDSVFIFCDCLEAIEMATENEKPAVHVQLARDIQARVVALRKKVKLEVLWVPAHVGVTGNELANDAAQRAAKAVELSKPKPGQPRIPLAVCMAFIRRAQRAQVQEQWISYSLQRDVTEHLLRIKAGIARNPVFFSGSRAEQTVLARLRFGRTEMPTRRRGLQQMCDCGLEEETVSHFLLRCPAYERERSHMRQKIADRYDGAITEGVLLGTEGSSLELRDREEISHAVFAFVQETKRTI